MSTAPRQCEATNKRRRQCEAHALPDSPYCWFHDPAKVEERKQARANGGQARAGRTITQGNTQPRDIKTVGDVLALLNDTVGDCLLLENSLARAQTIARLAMAMVKCFEVNELEARMAALERALKLRGE